MKKIGIIVREFEENNKSFIGCRRDVLDVFLKYPVQIILIPIDLLWDQILYLVQLCDGIVLTGGDHFVDNDFLLVQYLYKQDIPTLGICLGMQAMALSFGGYGEIKVGNNHYLKEHAIVIKKNSLLYSILGVEQSVVNSRHKTGVQNTNLVVSARAFDGVIEAVEDKKKKFFLGLEWHPESLVNKKSDLIFEAFIKSLMK
ncbi:MAG TPA: gamma-glutamyl-gamma-aminobutyrate hydrolase family protein [Candidatus Caccenecus avistercoris]|nr:gamma-glutamyl-gamma-aminobutyrate hydrolase family protein [Candidatus Caccenecus avistercoris]